MTQAPASPFAVPTATASPAQDVFLICIDCQKKFATRAAFEGHRRDEHHRPALNRPAPKGDDAKAEHLVRQRAYEIFQTRGSAHGEDVKDWMQAESDLKKRHLPREPRDG